ncbi:Protein kinase-like domain [Pseudocohnilembus persalinus]|uniref:Protein kinase-like domain n=1 Tax=Pseudocohnilembus persalinus TaxID=266149 RepID=A0A0V0QX38_PSEPJ|nr:Protein kinase-like domain [Pseudocohnilembus persalinus]|eukprot:KRX06421.1 Protein kinase-like domain [Pseudocohnilembus persalinus]
MTGCYLFMEKADLDLLQYLNKNSQKRIDFPFLTFALKQMISSINFVHKQGKSHGDLKLDNFFFFNESQNEEKNQQEYQKLIEIKQVETTLHYQGNNQNNKNEIKNYLQQEQNYLQNAIKIGDFGYCYDKMINSYSELIKLFNTKQQSLLSPEIANIINSKQFYQFTEKNIEPINLQKNDIYLYGTILFQMVFIKDLEFLNNNINEILNCQTLEELYKILYKDKGVPKYILHFPQQQVYQFYKIVKSCLIQDQNERNITAQQLEDQINLIQQSL